MIENQENRSHQCFSGFASTAGSPVIFPTEASLVSSKETIGIHLFIRNNLKCLEKHNLVSNRFSVFLNRLACGMTEWWAMNCPLRLASPLIGCRNFQSWSCTRPSSRHFRGAKHSRLAAWHPDTTSWKSADTHFHSNSGRHLSIPYLDLKMWEADSSVARSLPTTQWMTIHRSIRYNIGIEYFWNCRKTWNHEPIESKQLQTAQQYNNIIVS